MITKEQLAERLNGREYTKEITKNEQKEAAESGLVVVFGASDDLIEFRGAIDDEQGACGGGAFSINNAGELFDEDHEDCCKYKAKARESAHKITAIWASEDYSWIYETKIPHSTFEIMEDGQKYCRGIVFSLQDIIYAAAEPDKKPETIRCGGCKKRKNFDCPFFGVIGVSVADDFYCAHCQSKEKEAEKKDAKMDSIDNHS